MCGRECVHASVVSVCLVCVVSCSDLACEGALDWLMSWFNLCRASSLRLAKFGMRVARLMPLFQTLWSTSKRKRGSDSDSDAAAAGGASGVWRATAARGLKMNSCMIGAGQ